MLARKLFVVALLHLATFGYFVQGGGDNQTATIGEIRAWVERGTFDVGEYAQVTSDLSYYGGRSYSNKQPNMTFFVAPLYWAFHRSASALGIDTASVGYQFAASYLITLLCAGIWGALWGTLLFFVLRALFPNTTDNERITLSLMVPLSTMLLPYSTMAFVHSFESFWILMLIYAFIRYSQGANRRRDIFVLGLCYGLAVLSNPLMSLVAPVFGWVLLKNGGRWFEHGLVFAGGVTLMLTPLLIYNIICFDHPLHSNRAYQDPMFTSSKYFMGVFKPLKASRIIKTLFWSRRSLPPGQTFLLAFIPGAYLMFKHKILHRDVALLMGAITFVFLLFMSSFSGWYGGLSYGPRYITPLISIFVILSIPVFQRFKRTYISLMLASTLMMFVLTAVDPLGCAGDETRFPIFQCAFPSFLNGDVSTNPDPLFPSAEIEDYSFNLGQLAGLRGLWSLWPLIAFQALGLAFLVVLGRGASSGRPAG